MENEKYTEQQIEFEDSDGEQQSDPYETGKSDQYETGKSDPYETAKSDNVDSNSPSLPGKDADIEGNKISLEMESNSAYSWKEQGFSSGVTQDSFQDPSKKYYESQLSNDDDCLSNATDSQDIKDDHFIETTLKGQSNLLKCKPMQNVFAYMDMSKVLVTGGFNGVVGENWVKGKDQLNKLAHCVN